MQKNIAFLHPDLGIGGAERAIVDAAIALQSKSYNVTIFTNHHDEDHCFEETIDGRLKVIVVADFLPRSFLGKFSAFFAYFRFFVATLYLIFFGNNFDLIYIDQISAPIPLLKLFRYKVLFYAHYPDMLLSKQGGFIKRLYRIPIDSLERISLSYADRILYNSVFTSRVFQEHFSFLKKCDPIILYPVPNIDNLISTNPDHPFIDEKYNNTIFFLSINRYEWKKNIDLGLKAFVMLNKMMINRGDNSLIHFVHFGGYDELVSENEEVYNYLMTLADTLKVTDRVTLLKSCPNHIKVNLLTKATVLLYTPSNEHFGIVPIEAMFLRCPVIAVNSGGPLETVQDTVTGFLCHPHTDTFAEAMDRFVLDAGLSARMGDAGHDRVVNQFSFDVFRNKLAVIVHELVQ